MDIAILGVCLCCQIICTFFVAQRECAHGCQVGKIELNTGQKLYCSENSSVWGIYALVIWKTQEGKIEEACYNAR